MPGQVLWVDLVVPRGDQWWHDDVGRAAHPVGRAWAEALQQLGSPASVNEGPLLSSPWSAVLCFAGLGPGEVSVRGRKVIGIAQRRTRAGACFQCAVALVAPGRRSAEAAGLTGGPAAAATAALDDRSTSLDHAPDELLAALRGVLDG